MAVKKSTPPPGNSTISLDDRNLHAELKVEAAKRGVPMKILIRALLKLGIDGLKSGRIKLDF